MKVVVPQDLLGDGSRVLDFEMVGLHLISGPNGIGKTKLLERISQGDIRIEFDDPTQRRAYEECRGRLITCVPQQLERPSCTVEEYACKWNASITFDDVRYYLTRLGLGDLSPKQKVRTLSGGELRRLAIASALAKMTPYVFLDEPSNDLDDGATAKLVSLLNEEEAPYRSVVVVSHDPRLTLDWTSMTFMNEGCVYQEFVEVEDLGEGNAEPGVGNTDDADKKTWSLGLPVVCRARDLAKKLHNGATFWLCRALALLVLVNLLMMNCGTLSTRYCLPGDFSEGQMIFSGDMGGDSSELNATYARWAGIDIGANAGAMASFDDLAGLVGSGDVSAAYVENATYCEGSDKGFDIKEGLAKVAIQEQLWGEHKALEDTFEAMDCFGILAGCAPADDGREIALPKDVALRKTGEAEVENALGKKVSFDGERYELVGICLDGAAWVSLDEKSKDFAAFVEVEPGNASDVAKAAQVGSPSEAVTASLLFFDGDEKVLLHKLLVAYPDMYCGCKTLADGWSKAMNQDLAMSMLPINVLAALFVAAVWYAIRRSGWRETRVLMRDMAAYYLGNMGVIRGFAQLGALFDGLVLLCCASCCIVAYMHYGFVGLILGAAYVLPLGAAMALSYRFCLSEEVV